MFARFVFAAALAVVVGISATAQDKKPEEKKEERKGTVTGVVTSKEDKWIEVKADGEEKARKYLTTQADPDTQKLLKDLAVGSRVSLDWRFQEVFRLVKLEVLKKPTKDEKKPEEKKDEPRGGTVTGLVTAKGENWIEVKADGEEKARRYVPHWKGGAPAAGGGPDKEMVAEIKKVPLNSRIELKWVFEERPRVEKITILKKPEEKKEQ